MIRLFVGILLVFILVESKIEDGSQNLISTEQRGHTWHHTHNPRSSTPFHLIQIPAGTVGKNCSTECNKHGDCQDGICVCHKDYLGEDCSVPSCDKLNGCSHRGICVSPQNCQCEKGWELDDCSIANCSMVSWCSGRGICIAPNKCQCEKGWEKDDCSFESQCTHNCSGHGHCLSGSGNCYCDKGWDGDKCTFFTEQPKQKKWKRIYPPLDGVIEYDSNGQPFTNGVKSNSLGAKPASRHGHTITHFPIDNTGIIGQFLLFGGESSNRMLDDIWSYQLSQKSWSHSSLFQITPTGRTHHTAVLIQNDIYIYGGYDEKYKKLNDIWKYSIEFEEWTELSSTTSEYKDNPTNPISSRAMHTGVKLIIDKEELMIIFGGVTEENTVDNVLWGFNPLSLIWNKYESAPFDGVFGHTAVANSDGTEMYIFGGFTSGGVLTTDSKVWKYSVQTKLWSSSQDFGAPPVRAHHVSVLHDQKMVIFGGETANKRYNDIWIWDPLTSSWSEITPSSSNFHQPPPHSRGAATLLGGYQMVIHGGFGEGTNRNLNSLWMFDFSKKMWHRHITNGATPDKRLLHSGIVIDESLHIFGGENELGEKLRDLWVFDLNNHVTRQQQNRILWEQIFPQWNVEQINDNNNNNNNNENGKVVIITDSYCTCKDKSVNSETGITHFGCAINGYEGQNAWCDTIESCKFGQYWDFCSSNNTQQKYQPSKSKDGRVYYELASWPSARNGHSVTKATFNGAVAGICSRTQHNVMIIFGGNTTNDVTDEIFVYCPLSRQWNVLEKTNSPGKRMLSAITSDDYYLYIFGGINSNKIRMNDIWRCSLRSGVCSELFTDGWTPQRRRSMLFSLETTPSCPSGCKEKEPNRLLMFNGYWKTIETQISPSDVYSSYIPHRCISTKLPFTDKYCDRHCFYNILSSECQTSCKCINDTAMDLWELSLDNWKWDIIKTDVQPPIRYSTHAISFEGKWWMFGGFLDQKEFDDVWVFDFSRHQWKELKTSENAMIPSGRHEGTFDVFQKNNNPHLLVYGGIGEVGLLDDIWVCDISDVIF